MSTRFIAPDFWEEHCIECGAPLCYKTCDKYARAPGGYCRRFANGIEWCDNKSFSVQFLPWGKLEMYWQGRMVKERVVYTLRRICNWLERPIILNVISDRLFRGFRRRLVHLFGTRNVKPLTWGLQCNSEVQTELLLAVADSGNNIVLEKRLLLNPGDNSYAIVLPKLCGPSYFRLSSITGSVGKIYFSKCEIVAEEIKRNNVGAPAKYVKCVAWDLDNTLWKGVLVNDGPDNVKIRNEVVDVIKALDRRGILNTVCSKNDFQVAWDKLDALGVKEYFVFPQINWNPKSENLLRIAKEINIGIDSIAFVDDSPNERGEVQDNLSAVRVFDEMDCLNFLHMDEFDPPVSSESGSRRQQYLIEMGRKKDEECYVGNHNEFLRKCNIVLSCEHIKTSDVYKRCWELVNRTNQLTLAAHRYAEDEFIEFAHTHDAYVIRCRDKYGDYGVVGFIAFDVKKPEVEVSEFVMSCRVAKKFCEQSVLLKFASHFKESGHSAMRAIVVETGRNMALLEAFEVMPFLREKEGTSILYKLDFSATDWSRIFSNRVDIL